MLPSSLTNILAHEAKPVSPHAGQKLKHLAEGDIHKIQGPVEVCVEKDGLIHIHYTPFETTLTGPLEYTHLRRTPEYIYSKSIWQVRPLSNLKMLLTMGALIPSTIVLLHFLFVPFLGDNFNTFYVSVPAILCLILSHILPYKILEATAENRVQTCVLAQDVQAPSADIDLAPDLKAQFDAVLARIEEALNGPLPSAKAATLRHARVALNDLMGKLQSNAQLQRSPQAISHVQNFLAQTQDRMVPLLEHHQTIALDDLTAELSALNTQLERL